ncbi:unnamed protein product [Effrenium voratum]|uniref:Calreticulin n=1 Tax=Effrenium voratum TaxID=2562239 RepID=A0AA36N153_9DINO|nr:unnamed protein product [Effrenium voratum]CAJ1416797.1 unnamed protein product [Effrenium voratum]
MRWHCSLLLLPLALASRPPQVYFAEPFDDSWESRWVQSEAPGRNGPLARFQWSAGQWFVNETEQRGLYTVALSHHAASARVPRFSNRGRDLVVQFTVKHENEDLSFCGGAYLKLLGSDLDQKSFSADTPYQIMFGPDICGDEVSVIHLIFAWRGRQLQRSPEIPLAFDDRDAFSHIYSLVLKPDNTYKVYLDLKEKSSGALHDFWDYPKMTIDDPGDSKPKDWVEARRVIDDEKHKPEDWVEQPLIPDPFAWKPLEWDEEEDGAFMPAMVENPQYKGPWHPSWVDNPDFRGAWRPRQRGNPEYEEEVYSYTDLAGVGFELWSSQGGSVLDNVLLCDSWDFAKTEAQRLQDIFAKEAAARRSESKSSPEEGYLQQLREDLGFAGFDL